MTTPRNTTTGKTPFTPTTPGITSWNCCPEPKRSDYERENLRIQKDIRAPVSYQRRREQQQQAKMAESAAHFMREEDDEFQGILGMRLDSEMGSDKDVMSSPITSWLPAAFPAALPARRNPETVYPVPGERNRPRGGDNEGE